MSRILSVWRRALALTAMLDAIALNSLLTTPVKCQTSLGSNISLTSSRDVFSNESDPIFNATSATTTIRTTISTREKITTTPDGVLPENLPSNLTNCGRQKLSWICDPGQILDPTKADKLHDIIESVRTRQHCPCPGKCSRSYLVLVAIISELKYRKGENPVDPEEKLEATSKFAEYLRYVTWYDLTQCDDHVVIVYNVDDRMVSTSIGSAVRKHLTYVCADNIVSETKKSIEINDIFSSLQYILLQYRRVFNSERVCPADPAGQNRAGAANGLAIDYTILVGCLIAAPFVILALVWICKSCISRQRGQACCSSKESDC